MSSTPACQCFVNQKLYSEAPSSYYQKMSSEEGLTVQEKDCLWHLVQAWNLFQAIGGKHPQDDAEFCKAIHDAQKSVALRVARRVDKEVWNQYDS